MGVNGNFGYQEGLNYALPVSYDWGVGFQAGVGFHQSSFNGNAIDPTGSRDQTFFTGGVFHRALDVGWQYGVVFDALHDEFYVKADVQQLRAELSWLNGFGGEWGFTGTFGTHDDVQPFMGMMHQWDPIDQYTFFHRRRLQVGGEVRCWGGWTDNGDGLLGGEFLVPVSQRFLISASGNYLIPNTTGPADISSEAWGVTINLVWYPGMRALTEGGNAFRPLFNVADNNSFLVNRMTK
jgi:hypothetical protein